MKNLKRLILLVIFLVVIISCSGGGNNNRIDLSGIVETDLANLGSAPTKIAIRNGEAYVLNGLSNNIQVFDIDQSPPQEISTLILPPGSDPVAIDFFDDTKGFIANLIGQSVALVNLQTGDCELIILSQEIEVNLNCNQVVVIQNAFEEPSDLKVIDNKLYVTNNNFDEFFQPIGNGFITIIDTETNQLITIVESGGANSGNINMIDDQIYILNSGNFIFDVETSQFMCDPNFPPSISILDTKTDEIIETIDIPLSETNSLVCAPSSMEFTSDKRSAYLGLSLVGAMLKVNLENNAVINGSDNPIVVTDLSGLNTITDVVFSKNGFGFAALFNTDQIAVFDPNTDELNPFPFIEPIPAGIKATNQDSEFFDGVQFLATRDGSFKGPEIFFITGISSKLGSVDPDLLLQ